MTTPSFPLHGIDGVFDHLGVVVRSITAIDASLEVIDDERQRVGVAFTDWGGLRVELIEPRGNPSPVSRTVGQGRPLAHLCFRVPDLEAAIRRARHHGLHRISGPTPARAFANRRIAWLFSVTHGLIELLEDVRPDRAGADAAHD